MKIPDKRLKKSYYEHDNLEYIVLNKCPHCNLDIHPTVENIYSIENNTFKVKALSLTCPSCKKDFFIFNDFRDEAISKEKYLSSIPLYSYSENSLIQNTSEKFQKLYTQSTNSEVLGFHDIAFFGYIKSLEILLKDIAIIEQPEAEDVIIFCNLMTCLEQFHATNLHLFSKKLLEILKNDYLHYQKSTEFHTYTELVKDCIDYFLLYLELLLKTMILNNKADHIKKEQ